MVPCPRHYGITVNAPYFKKNHDSKALFSQQLTWLINKGDLLLADEERGIEHVLIEQFREDSNRVFKVPIYGYSGDDAPSRYLIAREGGGSPCILFDTAGTNHYHRGDPDGCA